MTWSLPCTCFRRKLKVTHVRRASQGFTLVEMIIVMAIIAILSSIIFLSLPGLKGAQDMSNAAYTIKGVLEQARTYAMANNTYVWVGLFEEDPTKATFTPGTGQVDISVVASQDGSRIYNPLNLTAASFAGQYYKYSTSSQTSTQTTYTQADRLFQISKLIKIPGLDIYPLISQTNIPSLPNATVLPPADQVNSSANAFAPYNANLYFNFPLASPTVTPAATTNITQIIEFSPQGDASPINQTPTQDIQIGLRPARGSSAITTSTDIIAVQISGIGGQVITYRP